MNIYELNNEEICIIYLLLYVLTNFLIFMLLICRQKYQELFRLESRKEKRKVKKRRKSRHKSLDTPAAASSGNKTPKITYNNRAGTHKSQQQHHLHAGTHNSRHHHSAAAHYSSHGATIPSIRVESPSAVKMEGQQRQSAISVKNLSSYGGRDEDSDEPRSAAGGDTDDSDSERVKAGGGGDESPRAANNSFHETFAKFRQSYLSSATATAPKKV